MKTRLFYAIIIAIGFFTSCTTTPEEKAEKQFKQWVKENFDNPNDLKEVISVEVTEQGHVNTDTLKNFINRMDKLYSWTDSLFDEGFENISLFVEKGSVTSKNRSDGERLSEIFSPYIRSSKRDEYDSMRDRINKYLDAKIEDIDRTIYDIKVRVKAGQTTKVETYQLYVNNITGESFANKDFIKRSQLPDTEQDITDIFIDGVEVYKDNRDDIITINILSNKMVDGIKSK